MYVAVLKKFFNALSRPFQSNPNKLGSDGLSRLQSAILQDDYIKVRKLIESGVDFNDRALLKFPPLHLALLKDRHLIASLLINSGADINARDADQRTPLHIAAAQGQDFLVYTLLQKKPDLNARDKDGRTPLHKVSTSRPEIIDRLVDAGVDINAQDKTGNTALHMFIDKPAMAGALLAYQPDVNIQNDYNNTAFRQFLNDDKLVADRALMRLMLENGADLKAQNSDGENLAMSLVRLGINHDIAAIIRRVDMTQTDKAGRNLVHKALRAQNDVALTEILAAAPQLMQQTGDNGQQPLSESLYRAFECAYLVSLDSLETNVKQLSDAGGDINTCDKYGRTLSHYAVRYQRYDFMEWLAEKGSDLDKCDAEGKAAIHYAIDRKDMRMLDILLDAGANPDQTDHRGWTILDRLAEKNDRNSPMVQRLIVAGGQYCKQLPLNPNDMRKADPRANDGFFKKDGKPGKGPHFGG